MGEEMSHVDNGDYRGSDDTPISKLTTQELVEELAKREGAFHITTPKSGRSELALEDLHKQIEKFMPNGDRYMSTYYYDEIFEGELSIIVVRKS
jgi:hypothetical protein